MKLVASVLAVAASAVFLSACGDAGDLLEEPVASTEQAVNQTFAQHQAACQADPRVQSGVVSLTECIGADIFFKENFNGNGRTCGTCHRVERNFAIDPAFIARLPNSDKLFIAEHTTDGLPLDNLEVPSQLRARGLILENVDGTEPEGPTVRFVLRPTGALNRSGSNLASYLLFEQAFCRALIDLGYDDTLRREAEVRDFFDYSEGRIHA